jgi:hypothetical protein
MTNLQTLSDVSWSDAPLSNLVVDDFEEGWDCGVDWANEHAVYRSLRLVQQLRARHCSDLTMLTETLGCNAIDLFGQTSGISERRVEGFIDGAVAILHEGGL